jgi:dinuclear metal center YbgI/SA1388 family protein
MNIDDFDGWAQSLLDIPRFRTVDDSLNGLQIGRSNGSLKMVAFAVDACLETIKRARQAGAQALFVHHGLFWGKPIAIKGSLRDRIAELLSADMALYACHLPLDAHPVLGNNAVLARMLGLADIQPFGEYHGISIGCKGRFESPVSMDEVVRRILPDGEIPRTVLPFGPAKSGTAAIVSGGAPFEALQAINQSIDLYITGEPSHSIYHQVQEAGLNFVAAGHYATEVHGVRAIAGRVSRELGLETLFIESPTGL